MLPQILLDRSSGVALHRQLTEELRRLILSGGLLAGTRLPATREAAAELGVSRNVVVLAYQQLQVEGYLRSAVGVGTWVPRSLGRQLLSPKPAPTSGPSSMRGMGAVRLSKRGGQLSRRAAAPLHRPTYPLRPSAIAVEHFPARTWARIASRLWKTRTASLVRYGHIQGYQPLREVISEHLTRYRGVRLSSDQILMTSGSQQSLDMIARMLVDPGDAAAIENPGYDGAISALRGIGAKLVPVPVDRDGLALQDASSKIGSARLLYTSPSHQYPLGVTLSLERRLGLLEWAAARECWIVEDDYDSEFRFESRPLPALQGLDSVGNVVYVGTFSKVLAPGLRIGFIVLPERLVEPFAQARQVLDQHPSVPTQMVLTEFIAEGHLERHIARMRTVYAARRAALRSAIEEHLSGAFEVIPSDGGLHLAGYLTEAVDDVLLSRHAFDRGIDPQPLSVHYLGNKSRRGLILGYGGVPEDQLYAAVKLLKECIDSAAA